MNAPLDLVSNAAEDWHRPGAVEKGSACV